MIRKLFNKLFRSKSSKAGHAKLEQHSIELASKLRGLHRPVLGAKKTAKARHGHREGAAVIAVGRHQIDRNELSNAAIRTIESLQKAGFEAYVVGGAVRDLLLQRHPKDFDVATDATPEEVHRIFRRSRIIGRRFRLVHVIFGSETIEVSTFRGHHHAEGDAHTDVSGRILRDNVFGSLQEDATRRDFTVNALYYDPTSQEVLDFHRGFEDVQASTLRMIGSPETRYAEDPVGCCVRYDYPQSWDFILMWPPWRQLPRWRICFKTCHRAAFLMKCSSCFCLAMLLKASVSCVSSICIMACCPCWTWCWSSRLVSVL